MVSYYHEPDKTGHHYGPDSREVADKVKEMDGVLGKIMEAIESSNKLKNNVRMHANMHALWDKTRSF